MRLRGRWGSYRGIPVMPTYHPSFLLRQPDRKKEAWEDLLKVLERLGLPAPQPEGRGRRREGRSGGVGTRVPRFRSPWRAPSSSARPRPRRQAAARAALPRAGPARPRPAPAGRPPRSAPSRRPSRPSRRRRRRRSAPPRTTTRPATDARRDLADLYVDYHPYFVRGDLDGDGRLDFAQAFVEKGPGRAWFHVAVFFGTRRTAASSRRSGWSARSPSRPATSSIERTLLDRDSRPRRSTRRGAGVGTGRRGRFVDADADAAPGRRRQDDGRTRRDAAGPDLTCRRAASRSSSRTGFPGLPSYRPPRGRRGRPIGARVAAPFGSGS